MMFVVIPRNPTYYGIVNVVADRPPNSDQLLGARERPVGANFLPPSAVVQIVHSVRGPYHQLLIRSFMLGGFSGVFLLSMEGKQNSHC